MVRVEGERCDVAQLTGAQFGFRADDGAPVFPSKDEAQLVAFALMKQDAVALNFEHFWGSKVVVYCSSASGRHTIPF